MANKAEKEIIPFLNRTVEVHRRAFRRSVSIYLYPKKPIKVVAGKLTSVKTIYDFLLTKKDWIENNLSRFDEIAAKFPDKKIKSYEVFPFLGESLPLKVKVTVLDKPFVAIQDGELRLHIPHQHWHAGVLTDEHPQLLTPIRDFYKREALRRITARAEFWAREMKLFPTALKFREPRTRWGSCSSAGVVNLNWRLIVFKPEIIDYVIVHELAHLKHLNHSPRFWDLVQAHLPAFETSRKELREAQAQCEFLNLAATEA
jgi:predicted metal-dependent hydrolase